MATRTISQRIALTGSEEVRKQLAALGEWGEKAFRDIQAAAEKLRGPGAEFARNMDRARKRVAELGDQFDKVGRGEAAKCRLGEMGIGRQEVRGRRTDIGEIAPPAARNQDLAAGLRRMIEEEDSASPLSRNCCAKHPRRTSADYDRVEGTYGRHELALTP